MKADPLSLIWQFPPICICLGAPQLTTASRSWQYVRLERLPIVASDLQMIFREWGIEDFKTLHEIEHWTSPRRIQVLAHLILHVYIRSLVIYWHVSPRNCLPDQTTTGHDQIYREERAIHEGFQPPFLASMIRVVLATPSWSAQRSFASVDGIPIRHLRFGLCVRRAGKLLRRRTFLDQLPSRQKLIREAGLSPLQSEALTVYITGPSGYSSRRSVAGSPSPS